MNLNRGLTLVLAEATETYHTQGTLGADADGLTRFLANHLEAARQHAAACNDLHSAVRRAADDGAFCSGDYMVYFTLAFQLGEIDLGVILQSLSEAARLSTTPEFGLAWDLIQVAALALKVAEQPPSNEDAVRLFGQLFATVLTSPIPAGRESELPSNIAAILRQLPPYMSVAIFNATAHGLRERRPRYNTLAWVAWSHLSTRLSPDEQVTFICGYWLPAIDPSAESSFVLDMAMNAAIVAIEDARSTGDELDSLLRFLLHQLVKYPLRARLEYCRHVVRLAKQLSASRSALAFARVQRAQWLGSTDRVEAAYELREARALWLSEEVPREIETQVLFAEAAMAFQEGQYDEALRVSQRAVDCASGSPELLAYAQSRLNTLSVMLGRQVDPTVTTADPNYMEHVSRLYAEATVMFQRDQLERCVQLVDEALGLPRPTVASEAQYTRRRAYLLRAAAQLRAGRLEESLGSVLDAIDELTDGIRRHISGTEQAARRDRFAEVEALLDRGLQILSQDPLAFDWTTFERLWELLVQYRDIDLEFNDSILRLHRAGIEGPIASYRETRDLLAALELDGCATLPGQSDAAAIGLYARLTTAVRHTLYNTEITLSESPSYAESIRRRLQTRLPEILAQLREDEMLVEFVNFWSGMMADGVGLRSLMAFTVSATKPQRLLVIADRRTCPSRDLVVQTLLDLDLRPSESIDLPVGESDLARALVHQAQETRARRLLCVPDGPVKLINVAALPYADGHLADHLDVAYLGHAADLLLDRSSSAPGPSAVFGDAEFDQPLSQPEDACVNDRRAPTQFPELPATAAEADWVAAQLRVGPTTRDKATAAAFRMLRSPLVLHVATHGVFDEGYALPSLAATGGHNYGTLLRETVAYPRLAPERPMEPALRSGVALAGINWWLRGLHRGDDNECGYISAYDISWMDLTGTRLAVFSGCRTGRGPDERYLGLVDLRRAVRMAGAWEFIAAIWSVPDTASALLMHLMYSCASGPSPTAEDLGRAQQILRHATVGDVRSWLARWPTPPTFGGSYLREVLRQPDDHRPFADPYYWAGFVCYTSGRARRPVQKEREPDGRHRNEHQPTHVRGFIQRRLRARRPAAGSGARGNLDAAGPGT